MTEKLSDLMEQGLPFIMPRGGSFVSHGQDDCLFACALGSAEVAYRGANYFIGREFLPANAQVEKDLIAAVGYDIWDTYVASPISFKHYYQSEKMSLAGLIAELFDSGSMTIPEIIVWLRSIGK